MAIQKPDVLFRFLMVSPTIQKPNYGSYEWCYLLDIIMQKCQCNFFPFQYATTMRNMQRDSVRGMWDSDWLPNVSGKQAIYNGLAQYHQSRICNAQKAVGEEIAR